MVYVVNIWFSLVNIWLTMVNNHMINFGVVQLKRKNGHRFQANMTEADADY